MIDFYLLRTPLLSIERLLMILEQEQLAKVIEEPLIGEAIRMASPSFFAQLQTDRNLCREELRQTALKYVLRMGSRCTPFGRFAGCSVGNLSRSTALDMTHRQLMSYYWLDMQVLFQLTAQLEKNPQIRPFLKFWPNSSLYRIGRQFRYIESSLDEQTTRNFISQVVATPAVRLVIRAAHHGATIDQLVQVLIHKNYFETDARNLIEQLIEDQILRSELTPSVTGPDGLTRVVDTLGRIPGGEAVCNSVQQLQAVLQLSLMASTPDMAIREILVQQLAVPLPSQPTVQCDSFFTNLTNQLNSSILNSLGRTFEHLIELSPLAVTHTMPALRAFKQEFYARYEEQEIPLNIALDSEIGVGYGTKHLTGDFPLIQDILPESTVPDSPNLDTITQQWLLQLYTTWLKQGSETIQLTEEDLRPLQKYTPRTPDSYYALGYFLASSSQAVDAGDYQFVLKGLGGASAFNLMGRFCRDDAQLTEQIRMNFKQLQQKEPHRIYAEIAHLPSIRAGNVVQRPHLRAYEIPYLTHSTLPRRQQIRLDELWVSVPGGQRVVLRSRRLGKEVLPRLTTAHNYQMGLPLYHFLGDLQQQDNPLGVAWQWGWLSQVRHLPRIQYRQVILKEARWRLDVSDLDTTLSTTVNLTSWRQTWHVPRFVAIEQADQELFLDLDRAACQALLITTLQRLKTLWLIEWLRSPDRCCVTGPDGKLTHEIILPFTGTGSKPSAPSVSPVSSAVERTHVPGSNWVYLKVYTGPGTAPIVLTKLGKLAQKLIRNGQITHWFFIRYQDPEFHLRIRFHVVDPLKGSALLGACQKALQRLIDSEEVYRLQVDTYKREIERYGGNTLEATEWLFWADSEAVFQLHQRFPMDQEPLAAALLGMDAYLTDFGYTLGEKLMLCQQGFQSLFDEQGDPASNRKGLARQYRANESLIMRVLNQRNLSAQESACQQLFRKRSRRIKPFLELILSAQGVPPRYVASLLHLFINRLFLQHPRTYELLVYHHLARGYHSLQVRAQ